MEPKKCCTEERYEFRDNSGKDLVKFCNILRMEGDDKSTAFYLLPENPDKPVYTKTQTGNIGVHYNRLKHTDMFCRVHNSHVVNILYIKRVEAHFVTMMDGTKVEVSEKFKPVLDSMLKSC